MSQWADRKSQDLPSRDETGKDKCLPGKVSLKEQLLQKGKQDEIRNDMGKSVIQGVGFHEPSIQDLPSSIDHDPEKQPCFPMAMFPSQEKLGIPKAKPSIQKMHQSIEKILFLIHSRCLPLSHS